MVTTKLCNSTGLIASFRFISRCDRFSVAQRRRIVVTATQLLAESRHSFQLKPLFHVFKFVQILVFQSPGSIPDCIVHNHLRECSGVYRPINREKSNELQRLKRYQKNMFISDVFFFSSFGKIDRQLSSTNKNIYQNERNLGHCPNEEIFYC